MTTIKRGIEVNNYTILSNNLCRDFNLSRAARGLLVELLSRPPDWVVSVRQLILAGREGKDVVYKLIKELISAGYMTRSEKRYSNGRIAGYDYVVFSSPQTQRNNLTAKQKTASWKSACGKTVYRKTDTTNKRIIQKEFLQNNNNTIPGEILRMIRERHRDNLTITNTLKTALITHGKEYVERCISYSNQNANRSYPTHLVRTIRENWAEGWLLPKHDNCTPTSEPLKRSDQNEAIEHCQKIIAMCSKT